MRVLHLTTEYPPVVYGGLGTAVGGLVSASARAGLDVAVLLVSAGGHGAYGGAATPAAGDKPDARRSSGGILLRCIPHVDVIRLAVQFTRQWRPDVVHVHVFWLAYVAMAIRDATGVPVVYTVHSLDRAEYEIGAGPPECLTQWDTQHDLIERADRVVALTDDERQLISTYCVNARARVRVVGNGIDDSAAARAAATRHRSGELLTVLYTGRFVDRKGIRDLLAAAPVVLSQASNVRFVLAGGHRGSSAHEVRRRWFPAECEPFSDRIVFTGWLDEDQLNRWYERADVLVVPSWHEPFGMVVLEGMLRGLAVVACDVGGRRAILRHEVTGLLCESRNPAHLAETLIRVFGHHELRARLGTQRRGRYGISGLSRPSCRECEASIPKWRGSSPVYWSLDVVPVTRGTYSRRSMTTGSVKPSSCHSR